MIVDRGPASSPPATVHVVSHGWHTGVVVPAEPLREHLPVLRSRFPTVRWLEVGWGDAAFYQADEITAGIVVRAVFWPTPTVVHVVGLHGSPQVEFPHSEVRSVDLGPGDLARLNRFLVASFDTATGDDAEPLGFGLYGDSEFFTGAGTYFAFNTCNKWTAKALASGGLDVDTRFGLTAGQMMAELGRLERGGAVELPVLPDR